MNDIIKQLELLSGTYLAKRSTLNFDECVQFLKDDDIIPVMARLYNLRGTDWEDRLFSYETMICEAGLVFLDLKTMIAILEKRERCEKCTWFSRIVKQFKFEWVPLRKGGVYKI